MDFDLARFVDAQKPVYEQVLAELAAGRKRTHWMWFVFPQIKGLGSSEMAQRYALSSLAEARAYLAHPLLGQRLRECTGLVNAVQNREKKPWTRMEQAIRAVDLLVQGGGFGVVVLDLGGIEPQYARRIPLATWFRWRAALERTRTSLLVLSQMGLTGSSAELALRVEAEMPAEGTVLTEISYKLEVVRRRFAEGVAGGRKGPGRAQADAATVWKAKALWA